MTTNQSPRTIKSVETAFEILEVLRQLDGGSVSEIAEHVDKTAGTVATHLATFVQQGYVVKTDNEYQFSPLFVTFGEYARNHSEIYLAAKEEVDELANETGEVAHVIVEHGGLGISLYQSFGEKAVRKDYLTRNREAPQDHLHCTAGGKAILAHYPKERVMEIIDAHGLPEYTDKTVTDRDALVSKFEDIRERGYAFNDGEEMIGLRAVGTEVQGPDGKIHGAISVSGPRASLTDERFTEKLPKMVCRTADVAEINLQSRSMKQSK